MSSNVSASPASSTLPAELRPWASLVEIANEDAGEAAWDEAAAAVTPAAVGPVLAGAHLRVDGRAIRHLVGRLAEAAGLSARVLDPARWLTAALIQDVTIVEEDAYALADLAARPLLLACGRRFAREHEHGWCPVCGAWPTLAELRGLERSRRLRCGRCGDDWASMPLRCVFCGNADHARLTPLVPENTLDARRALACDACRGYLKELPRLSPFAPELIALEDLASVELDLAALDRGYHRPDPRGAPGVRVELV